MRKSRALRGFQGKVSRIQQDQNKLVIKRAKNNGNVLKNYIECSDSNWTTFRRKGLRKGKFVGSDCKVIECEDKTPTNTFDDAVCGRDPEILSTLTITGFVPGSSLNLERMNSFDRNKIASL